VQPTNNTSVVCNNQLSFTGKIMSFLSKNLKHQHVSPNLHFKKMSGYNLYPNFSGKNQSSSSHNDAVLSNNNLNTNISNGNFFSPVTNNPSIVQWPPRVKKPPNRFGKWVKPITTNINHFKNHNIL
jgi:hypothetical protein